MKRIMFGNFQLGYEQKGKEAYCEIFDLKAQTRFQVDINKNGIAYIHRAGQKVSKQETFMKALKRLFDMYEKEVA